MSNPITIDLATKAKILTYYHNFTFHRDSAIAFEEIFKSELEKSGITQTEFFEMLDENERYKNAPDLYQFLNKINFNAIAEADLNSAAYIYNEPERFRLEHVAFSLTQALYRLNAQKEKSETLVIAPEFRQLHYQLLSNNLDDYLERFYVATEGSTCSTDKARFTRRQLLKHIQTNQNQKLYEYYTTENQIKLNVSPDTKTYWSSKKLEDTTPFIEKIKTDLYL